MTLKNKFKIFDNQNFTYKFDGQWFTNKEAVQALADFHDVDYTGQIVLKDESGNEQRDEQGQLQYRDCTIYEKLDTLADDDSKIVYLCEYGDWDTHEAIYWNTDNGGCMGGDYFEEQTIKETLDNNPTWDCEVRYYLAD